MRRVRPRRRAAAAGRRVGPWRGPAVAVAVAIALVSAVGCTEEPRLTKDQYERRLHGVAGRFAATIDEIFSSPEMRDPGSLAAAADLIRKGGATMREAADELDALRPPEEAEGGHEKLIRGFREFADDLDRFAQDAEELDIEGVGAFAERLASDGLPATDLITEALQELRARGFDVGG